MAELSDGVPERCLSFEIRGPFAHFRRIEGNIVKQTYRIIPRTTLAGLCAAILGIGRDEYYEIFSRKASRVAIQPVGELRSIDLPELTLSTNDSAMETHGTTRTAKIRLPKPEADRQQHNYEVLVDPSYRIDVSLADNEVYAALRDHLEGGRSHYTPSLGLSEHLASIDYLGEFTPTPADSDEPEIASAVPNESDSIIAEPGRSWSLERSPAFMEARSGGRVTTGFTTYAYRSDGGTLTVADADAAVVDGRTVMFS